MQIAELLDCVERIGRDVARKHAAAVDAEPRFPHETFAALREEKILSAAVPTEFGGFGCNVVELTRICQTLGEHCSASSMNLGMHFIQVASIANHANGSTELHDYLRRIVTEQRLIASATSEVGTGGDMRQSICAVTMDGDRFSVSKQGTTISYGQYADDILLTARRADESAGGDQVAVLLLKEDLNLETTGTWNTLGMRGTCSPGGVVSGTGEAWQVMSEPFGTIAAVTMVPYSHILWGGTWLGIASDAVKTASAQIRKQARKNAGTMPPAANNLGIVVEKLNRMRAEVYDAARECLELVEGNQEEMSSIGYALRINNLKLSASTQVADIVTDAMRVCGIMAYKNDSDISLGRHLRDAHSAALMISNDRIRATNASYLLLHKGT